MPFRSPSTERDHVDISLYGISVWVLPVLIAITFHEAAHAFVAYRLGDNTARELGRAACGMNCRIAGRYANNDLECPKFLRF